ncbi:MAG: class I SAM-dependent methyltransferase [Clostridia bacterium]
MRWASAITAGPVLDVACGGGRHARFFRDRGFDVVATDRTPVELGGIRFVESDLEQGRWPFEGQKFGAIVVTNYLHRPLFPHLVESLGPGGVLIYETFMAGNERFGRPSNPDFLLKPQELLKAFSALEVLGFEEGQVERPKPAMTQRICARKSANL